MGRMHSRGKGISAFALPYKRSPPTWLKTSPQDVDESICKCTKKGLTPSQIGVILRDSHGIPQVKSVSGSKILRIQKAHGLTPEILEYMYHLIKFHSRSRNWSASGKSCVPRWRFNRNRKCTLVLRAKASNSSTTNKSDGEFIFYHSSSSWSQNTLI